MRKLQQHKNRLYSNRQRAVDVVSNYLVNTFNRCRIEPGTAKWSCSLAHEHTNNACLIYIYTHWPTLFCIHDTANADSVSPFHKERNIAELCLLVLPWIDLLSCSWLIRVDEKRVIFIVLSRGLLLEHVTIMMGSPIMTPACIIHHLDYSILGYWWYIVWLHLRHQFNNGTPSPGCCCWSGERHHDWSMGTIKHPIRSWGDKRKQKNSTQCLPEKVTLWFSCWVCSFQCSDCWSYPIQGSSLLIAIHMLVTCWCGWWVTTWGKMTTLLIHWECLLETYL